MCTFSLVPASTPDGRYSVMISRDESHFRAAAFEPSVLTVRGVRTLMPIDSEAGGTWIAVNHFGLTMALLNYAPGNSPTVLPRGRRSRGAVIPQLIHAATVAEAIEEILAYDTSETSPFRLLMTDGTAMAAVVAPGFGRPMRLTTHEVAEPMVFASSGLGDEIVEPVRQDLARKLFATPPSQWLESQRQLHLHRWMHAPHLSVYMLRQDARTVSITSVEASNAAIVMRYAAELGGRFAPQHTTHLDRVQTGMIMTKPINRKQAPAP